MKATCSCVLKCMDHSKVTDCDDECVYICTKHLNVDKYRTTDGNDYESITSMFRACITEGKFLVMRYQSPNGYGYKTLIGHDNKGKIPYSYAPTTLKTSDGDDYFILPNLTTITTIFKTDILQTAVTTL